MGYLKGCWVFGIFSFYSLFLCFYPDVALSLENFLYLIFYKLFYLYFNKANCWIYFAFYFEIDLFLFWFIWGVFYLFYCYFCYVDLFFTTFYSFLLICIFYTELLLLFFTKGGTFSRGIKFFLESIVFFFSFSTDLLFPVAL